ncbi:hypothetical protein LZ30DRAFT_729662 [Colletotrichum cereale]|nr:hypothetical protein LZ30DRAFT_729662 [Colletotrichum cereale]
MHTYRQHRLPLPLLLASRLSPSALFPPTDSVPHLSSSSPSFSFSDFRASALVFPLTRHWPRRPAKTQSPGGLTLATRSPPGVHYERPQDF